MRRFGLDPHDTADAYTLWWISAWSAANLDRGTPSPQTIAAVRVQSRAAMDNVQVPAPDDDAWQNYAEALMIQAALLDSALERTQGDPAAEAELVRATLSGARASGVILSAMKLTKDGFVKR